MPYAGLVSAVNSVNPPFNNLKIRQAMYAALNMDEIMESAFYFKDLYQVYCGYIDDSVELWATETGCEYHNQANPAKARQLLEEAGYDGTPIIILGMTEMGFLRHSTQVVANQLEAAGFNVDLQLTDQGTWLANYFNPGNWHMGVAIQSHLIEPTAFPWTNDVHTGWWQGETPRKKELCALLHSETDHSKRFAIWEELHALRHYEAAGITFGKASMLSASSHNTGGWNECPVKMHRPRYWNIWIK